MNETETRRTRGKTLTVWVGFSDGKPHIYRDEFARVMAVFPSRRAASICYEDARKYEMRAIRATAKGKP